jgi:hypothetical protein
MSAVNAERLVFGQRCRCSSHVSECGCATRIIQPLALGLLHADHPNRTGVLCIFLCFALGIANIFHATFVIAFSIVCLYAVPSPAFPIPR